MSMTRRGKTGLVFAAIHITAFLWFLSYLNSSSGQDGQEPLLWSYWLVIDFPVSLLVVLLFAFDVTAHYVMYFVHGSLGTIWWFYIPTILYGIFKKVASVRQL